MKIGGNTVWDARITSMAKSPPGMGRKNRWTPSRFASTRWAGILYRDGFQRIDRRARQKEISVPYQSRWTKRPKIYRICSPKERRSTSSSPTKGGSPPTRIWAITLISSLSPSSTTSNWTVACLMPKSKSSYTSQRKNQKNSTPFDQTKSKTPCLARSF